MSYSFMAGGLSLQLLESLTPCHVVVAASVFILSCFVVDFTSKPRYPKSIPRVGYGDGIVGTLKNWVGYVGHFNGWVQEGYDKYSKHGRCFVVPSAASRPHEIVVPRSQTMWMLEMPDRVLSSKAAQDDFLSSEYNFLGTNNKLSINTIHKHLPRHLVALIPGIQEEIENAMDTAFGKDTENWKELNLWDAWLEVVPRVTNRILVGQPVCQNREFLDAEIAFADAVVTNSFVFNMFPRIIHPIVGPVLSMVNWRLWRKATRIVKPTIETTLCSMIKKAAGDPEYQDWEPEESLITWLVRQCMEEGTIDSVDVPTLSKHLLPVEFAAIHTTLLTLHNLTLDLLSTDPSHGYIDSLRNELAFVLREEGGCWSKQGLLRLYRTDSAIRESMRLSHFATSLVHRKVIAKEGITNTAEGWHAPYGSYLMLHLACLHHDNDIYKDPEEYDPFRFSRLRETYDAGSAEEKDAGKTLKAKRLAMTATSDFYMAFGHGKHACPGRFFVAHEMKMILAHLLQNYELKHVVDRPKPQWIGQTVIPPLQARIEILRKKGST